MNDNAEETAKQAAAFQKIWLESISKIMQTVFTFGPDSAPPEVVREIRSGVFQALAKSWEEFMRSPQFLEGMKQWMDNAVAFRQMSNDFMANVRNELQGTSRDDIDTIMLSVRHMEQRILDQVEELAAQVAELKGRLPGRSAKARRGPTRSPKRPAPRPRRKPQTGKGKVRAV